MQQSPQQQENQPPHYRSVAASRGLVWLTQAKQFFSEAPSRWLGCSTILTIILMFLIIAPFLLPLMAIFMGGILLGTRKQAQGTLLSLEDLFSGFSEKFSPLLGVGAIYFILTIVAKLIAGAIAPSLGIEVPDAQMVDLKDTEQLMALYQQRAPLTLLELLLMVPVFMGFWFSPALAVFTQVSPITAFKLSFFACLKNLAAFLTYVLVWVLLFNLSIIFVGLIGSLLGISIMMLLFVLVLLALNCLYLASLYTSFVDVFAGTLDGDEDQPDDDFDSLIV